MLRAPALALIVVVSILALADSVGADPRFDPYFELYTNPKPQSPSALTIELGLQQGLQASALVFYIPHDWGVARGEDIALGTKLGQVSSH
jgi:hypothetical protein